MNVRTVVAVLAAVLGLAACGDERAATQASPVPTADASPTPAAAFPSYSEADTLQMSEPVAFRGADGVRLEGRLFAGDGSREVGVVLGHMRPGNQADWFGFAALRADEGYDVLTYDRRGVCPGGDLGCSGGRATEPGWRDLAFAVDVLRDAGAGRVVVGGASLGAMESLFALSRGLDADGLIWISGVDLYGGVPVVEQVRDVRVPKLLVTGEFDNDAVTLGPEVERAAPAPATVLVLDTGEHGTEILGFGEPAVADQLRQAVLDFLATV